MWPTRPRRQFDVDHQKTLATLNETKAHHHHHHQRHKFLNFLHDKRSLFILLFFTFLNDNNKIPHL
jgi:hypothetical protein